LTAYTAVGNFSFVAGYAIDYSNAQKEGSLKNQALETRLSVLKGNSTAIVTVDIADKDATKWRNQIAGNELFNLNESEIKEIQDYFLKGKDVKKTVVYYGRMPFFNGLKWQSKK